VLLLTLRLAPVLKISALLVLLTWLPAALGETILLRNISLITKGESKETILVNVLIKDRILDLISEDDIAFDQADRAYNAKSGYIFGDLNINQPAEFLILSSDPHSDYTILLDTKRYARFAIHGGEIKRNYLPIITKKTDVYTTRKPKWTAYSPPPVPVSLNYQDSSRWNRYEGDLFSGLFAGALILDRQYWVDQNDDSRQQLGNLQEDYEGGVIRGLRFGGVGTVNLEKPWVWTLFLTTHSFDKGFDETEDDSLSVYDARVDIPIFSNSNLSVGKQKEPISMERIMSLTDAPMQERGAVSDALLPARNVGVVVSSHYFDKRTTLAVGAFNNWFDKDQPSSISDNATQLVGRATWAAWIADQDTKVLHFGLGLRHSDGKEGYNTSAGPEFSNAPKYLVTSHLETNDIQSYQMEASYRDGPYWLHSEYVRTDVDLSNTSSPSYDGYHVTASWVMTGEMRPYNYNSGIFGGIPISRSVNQNGWGAVELTTRYSQIDFDDDTINEGDMKIWSAGANWLLSPYTAVGLNYRYITLDKLGNDGISQGINLRLTLMLE
jgi:phosphate-selective porin OprO/OprP